MFCKPQRRNNFTWADTLTGAFGVLVWSFCCFLTASALKVRVSHQLSMGNGMIFRLDSARGVPD